MAKPRFDNHYIGVYLTENPLKNYTFNYKLNDKVVVLRGDILESHIEKLEYYEAMKVAEIFYNSTYLKFSIEPYAYELGRSLITNGSIVPAIHQVELDFSKVDA